MKRDYTMDFSYAELQTLQESLEFTEMMSDVDGATELKERIETKMMTAGMEIMKEICKKSDEE